MTLNRPIGVNRRTHLKFFCGEPSSDTAHNPPAVSVHFYGAARVPPSASLPLAVKKTTDLDLDRDPAGSVLASRTATGCPRRWSLTERIARTCLQYSLFTTRPPSSCPDVWIGKKTKTRCSTVSRSGFTITASGVFTPGYGKMSRAYRFGVVFAASLCRRPPAGSSLLPPQRRIPPALTTVMTVRQCVAAAMVVVMCLPHCPPWHSSWSRYSSTGTQWFLREGPHAHTV
jgi:hypothetical protein